MSGDWIKMRTSLLTSPKVNGIARRLSSSSDVSRVLSTGYVGGMSEIVSRNVMRHVTVSLLLVVWGAANEHTDNGVFKNADLSDIDDLVGVPGFGEAMESVGWAEYDQETNTVTLPNFNEYNTSGASRSAGAKTAAQRQKEYRDRKKQQISDVTRDVTNDVTGNRREEKRREEVNQSDTSLRSVSATDGGGCTSAKSAEQMTKDELWACGKSLLEQQGMPKAQCGSFVGKLVKEYGPDVVVEAVRAAVVERPADAAGFLKKTCMHRSSKAAKPSIHDIPTREAFAGPVAVDGAGRPIAIPETQNMEGVI